MKRLLVLSAIFLACAPAAEAHKLDKSEVRIGAEALVEDWALALADEQDYIYWTDRVGTCTRKSRHRIVCRALIRGHLVDYPNNGGHHIDTCRFRIPFYLKPHQERIYVDGKAAARTVRCTTTQPKGEQ